jgi:hypothetical protein
MKKNKLVNGFIIGTFVMLYILVSLISTIHVIDFFELSNPRGMAIALAIAFEVGAAASLASLITLDKMNKTLVWALFIAITAMQMQGNMYYAFQNLEDYQSWIELFNLVEEEPLFQKRILSLVSGAILPLIALGFIKSLVDYIKPDAEVKVIEEPGKQSNPEKEEDLFDWDRFAEEDSEEALTRDFDLVEDEWAKEDWEGLDGDLFGEEVETDNLEDDGKIDWVEDLTDEELDQVVDALADSEEFIVEDYIDKENPDLKKAVENVQPKPAVKSVDDAYRFGKNLYSTMVKKVNSDHLPKEEVTKAYKNLGLVDKRD